MNIKEQLKRITRGTPIWIQWIDTMSAEGWRSSGHLDVRDHDQQSRFRTVGFFVGVTRESVVVAATRKVQLLKGGHISYSDEWSIPFGSISKWGHLDLALDSRSTRTTLARLKAWLDARPDSSEAYADMEGVGADCEHAALKEWIEAEEARTK